MEAWRTMNDQPTHVPPNADYVPQVYMPLYGWIGGLIFKVTGPGFVPLRAFSFLMTLATAVLIYAVAVRESKNRIVAFGCAALFLAGYRLAGGWYELARVENLFVLLTLGGVAAAVYGRDSTRGLLLSGALLGLSLLTKQNGLIFAAGTGFYLLLNVRWRVLWFGLAFFLAGLGPMWLANLASDGWLYTYVFGVAYASPVALSRVWETLQREIFGVLLLLTLMLLLIIISPLIRLGLKEYVREVLSSGAWPIFIMAAVLVTIITRASVGGARQNYILGYAFLCLLPALVILEIARWRPSRQRPAYIGLILAVILQFLLVWLPASYTFFRNPTYTIYVPTREMEASGDRLIERIAAIEGPVWVMMHPPYALMAGKEPAVHIQSLWHGRFRGRDPMPADLVERIETQYYAAIISDETAYFEDDPALLSLLEANYTRAESLPLTQSPPTLSGPLARPQVIYLPK
jgi:hypothetical protein